MASYNRYEERIAELEAGLAAERALCDKLAKALTWDHNVTGDGSDLPSACPGCRALAAYCAARNTSSPPIAHSKVIQPSG